MANLKLNNVVVVAESGGAATVQSGVFKAADGTAAFTIANSTGVLSLSAALAALSVTGATTLTGNVTAAGDLTVTGGLTVNGTTTTINSTTLTVDDKNIELGSVASPSDSTADGGGFTLKGASDKTILWTNSLDSWVYNQGITVGLDGTGYDVTFYGATASAYMRWDENVDDLILAGAARIVVPEGQLVLGSVAVTQTATEINAHTSPGDVMALAIALG